MGGHDGPEYAHQALMDSSCLRVLEFVLKGARYNAVLGLLSGLSADLGEEWLVPTAGLKKSQLFVFLLK
jgi:hypothetical protein